MTAAKPVLQMTAAEIGAALDHLKPSEMRNMLRHYAGWSPDGFDLAYAQRAQEPYLADPLPPGCDETCPDTPAHRALTGRTVMS